MDDFTRDLIEMAYRTVKTAKRKKSDPVTVDQLTTQMDRHWITYRDGTVAMWANRIYARAQQKRLASLAESVYLHLAQHSEHWELTGGDDPTERWAEFVAWGIAVLQWIHLEIVDEAIAPRYTREDVVAWLSERQLVQLPLFQIDFV